jgi:hypothetical protein
MVEKTVYSLGAATAVPTVEYLVEMMVVDLVSMTVVLMAVA